MVGFWVAEQRSGQSHALTQPLREAAAQICCAIEEIDSRQSLVDARRSMMQAVETGEELEILGHGQAQVEPG